MSFLTLPSEKGTDMILNQKTILAFLSLALASPQLRAGVVRGTVFDRATKEPLIGATVRIQSSQTGTSTDIDGHYSLEVKKGAQTVYILYIV